MTGKLASFLLCAFIFTLALTGCQSHRFDKDMHLAFRENPQSMDPALSQDAIAAYALGPIYEQLFQYHYLKRPYELTTLLAEGMPQYSKDGLTVTIKVKKGVKFQDDPCFPGGHGRELVASDFIFAWKRIVDPKVRSEGWWIFDGKVVGVNAWRDAASKTGHADYSQNIEGFTELDNHTIQIKLLKKYPQLNYALAMAFTSPVPKEAVEKYGVEFGWHPVGTGPYVMKEFIRSSKIVYIKNESFHGENFPEKPSVVPAGMEDFDYGKPLPFADKLTVHIFIERQPMWLSFLKGQLDQTEIPKDNFSASVENGELKPELKKKGISLTADQSSTEWWIGFNMKDPVVGKNKFLRKAMAYAFDSKKHIELFGLGAALPSNQIVAPTTIGFNKDFPLREFDLVKAKAMLVKAGFPGGKGLGEINYDTEGSSNARQMGEFFKTQMAQIGINIKVNLHTRPEYFDLRKKSKTQIIYDGWIADYPDAENYMQLLYSPNASPGMNNSSFVNSEYDKLFLEMSGMAPSPARQKIINRMTDIAMEEQVWIPNWVAKLFNVQQVWLKNFLYSDFAYNVYKYYRVDAEKKKAVLK